MKAKENIKAKIKKKFGTIAAFARASGMDQYKLQIMFAKGTTPSLLELGKVEEFLKELKPAPQPYELDGETLKLLKAKIQEAGGVYKFCKDNPTFHMRQVYEVYGGVKKRKSKLIDRLMEHFKKIGSEPTTVV